VTPRIIGDLNAYIDDVMAHLAQRRSELRGALDVHRNGDSGSPRVTGSTSRSRSSASPGSR
jgi:hypothetical protein